MESKVMLQGRIRVYENGRVDRVNKDGTETRARVFVTGGRGGEYAAVSVDHKLRYIHRLVAEAFVEPYTGECVNHKDGCKMNNRANNLEWCTARENTQHAFDEHLIDHYRNDYHCIVCDALITDKHGDKHGMLCGRCERLVAAEAAKKVKRLRLDALSEDLEHASKQRKAEVFRDLYDHGFTLREIGGLCGISHEWVRKIMEAG